MNLAGYGSAVAGAPPPPTAADTAAAAAAASQQLHERPKYVFGQSVEHGHPQQQEDDTTRGVYSESPQVQSAYDAEAGYQDAQREYQMQAGDTGAYAYSGPGAGGYYAPDQTQTQTQTDMGGYYAEYAAGVGQYYDYSQYDQQPQAQPQYQAQAQHQPRPSQDAYGGM